VFIISQYRTSKQIFLDIFFKVLAEAEQIRKEADNIGPRAELEHWKKRTSKFNFLLEQLKAHKVRAVLGILHIAKSKLIPVRLFFNDNLKQDENLIFLVHAAN